MLDQGYCSQTDIMAYRFRLRKGQANGSPAAGLRMLVFMGSSMLISIKASRRVALFSLLLASAAAASFAAKKVEVEVTEMTVRRDAGLILVDTGLKNVSGRPLKGLTAIYKFYSVRHEVMSTQRSTVEEAALEPGAEASIHAQLEAPAKAVTVEVSAVSQGERELQVANTGPFTIEE